MWDLQPFAEAAAEFRAGEGKDPGRFRCAGALHVMGQVLYIDHFGKGDHFDADLIFVLSEKLLSLIRAISGAAVVRIARVGVIAPDNEVGAAEILADKGVPKGLAGPRHAHGQR